MGPRWFRTSDGRRPGGGREGYDREVVLGSRGSHRRSGHLTLEGCVRRTGKVCGTEGQTFSERT